ncbi:MAG: acylase [Acidobacteriota bacterium]
MSRRWPIRLAALIGVALVLGLTIAVLTAPSSELPAGLVPPEGTYDVRILRDSWGVPHIFGRTDADVAYGLAWAHAEDDFETIQGSLVAARGRLAAALGKQGAANDYMVQLLRVPEVVAAGYPELPADVRALCEAYAAGLNHFAARHPEQAIAWAYPIRGDDVVAGFVHKLPLFFGIDATLTELFADGPPPADETSSADPRSLEGAPVEAAILRGRDRLGLELGPVAGSNTFAVGPARSADGSTMLLINSHQPWEGPVAWYEAHLRSEQGWDMVGGVFPGAPLILHGHNRTLGWAHTVNKPDLIDVYELEIDPEDPYRYRFDGTWHTLEEETAAIEVKLWGPLRWTFKRPVLWSVHGPVVRGPRGTYALRFASYGEVGHVEQWYRMNKARTFDEWQAAMRLRAVPMFNTGYADRDGNVYYLYNASLPRRTAGYPWAQTLPGDTSATLWTETVGFDELPQVLNPESGFVQNCNNSPFATTLGPENPSPEDAPIGIERRLTNRGRRALELLGADASITLEELDAIKYDTAYASDSLMAGLVKRVRDLPAPDDLETRRARDELAAWDLGTEADNPRAALAILTLAPFLPITGEVERPTDEALVASLAQTAERLQQDFGRLTVPWGEVNRLRRGTIDLPLGGAPDVLRAVYGELDDDGRLVGLAGDSYILRVAWGPDGSLRSESIHQYGSATQDETSPHFADQAELFAERRMKPVWMDEAEIRAHLTREYRPGE